MEVVSHKTMERTDQQTPRLSCTFMLCMIWMILGILLHFILSTLFIDLLAFIESRISSDSPKSHTIFYIDFSWVAHGWFVVMGALLVMEFLHRWTLVRVESLIDVSKAFITETAVKKHEIELLELAGRRRANTFSSLSPSEKNAIFDVDVRSASEKYSSILSLIYNILKIAVIAFVISIKSVWFLCPLAIIVVISLLLNYFSGKKIEQIDVGFREVQRKATLRVRHFFESNDEIRGSGAKREAIESVARLQDLRIQSAMEKAEEHSASSDNQSILQNRVLLITLAGFAYFVLFLMNDSTISADIHSVMIIIPFFLKEIPNIMNYLVSIGSQRLMFCKATLAEKRLNKFSFSKEDQGVNIETTNVELSTEKASLSLHSHQANKPVNILEDVSVHLPKTGLVSIVGTSGSGKSSFAKLLIGLYRPNTGSVFLNAHSLGEISERSLKDIFAFSPQKPILYQDSMRGNLLLDQAPTKNQTKILHDLDMHTLLLEKGLNQHYTASSPSPPNIVVIREKIIQACKKIDSINFRSLTEIDLPRHLTIQDALGYYPSSFRRMLWLQTLCAKRRKVLSSKLGKNAHWNRRKSTTQ